MLRMDASVKLENCENILINRPKQLQPIVVVGQSASLFLIQYSAQIIN